MTFTPGNDNGNGYLCTNFHPIYWSCVYSSQVPSFSIPSDLRGIFPFGREHSLEYLRKVFTHVAFDTSILADEVVVPRERLLRAIFGMRPRRYHEHPYNLLLYCNIRKLGDVQRPVHFRLETSSEERSSGT